jgi:hypothetical protein
MDQGRNLPMLRQEPAGMVKHSTSLHTCNPTQHKQLTKPKTGQGHNLPMLRQKLAGMVKHAAGVVQLPIAALRH